MEMNIQKYMAFVKTVEYGSFTKASEILNYSQSGISRMIRDLEEDWQVCLLERNHTGIKPTSDGLRLLPRAKELCDTYEKMQMEIDDINGLSSGIIRIGTFSSIATHWLPNIINAFQKDYPNMEYELLLGDYTEIEKWVIDGRIDFGFLRLPTRIECDCIELENDRQMVVLPPNHHLCSMTQFPVKALNDYPFILLEKGEKAEITKIFESNEMKPQPKYTTWDDYAVMSMVEKGLGIAILPELILRRVPFNIEIRPLDVPAYRTIGIAIKDKNTMSIASRKFLEYINYRENM